MGSFPPNPQIRKIDEAPPYVPSLVRAVSLFRSVVSCLGLTVYADVCNIDDASHPFKVWVPGRGADLLGCNPDLYSALTVCACEEDCGKQAAVAAHSWRKRREQRHAPNPIGAAVQRCERDGRDRQARQAALRTARVRYYPTGISLTREDTIGCHHSLLRNGVRSHPRSVSSWFGLGRSRAVLLTC